MTRRHLAIPAFFLLASGTAAAQSATDCPACEPSGFVFFLVLAIIIFAVYFYLSGRKRAPEGPAEPEEGQAVPESPDEPDRREG